ncbi:MAG: Transcriptional regulator FrcR for fructose utilization, ROK family [uncultured Rubellimicrobium sp.]|uniref:Transcriptional regulator FrcR for fructose utilization, ROK family n=1 Tax=uncultured Rubellimicrobium sp. TaxID=543078 RepID=A0A6J4Q309_9RHOB|nr:MAG: Transcriptional regulator FrcR for fructose utilization, ROK family [uncultured Rubellimicrobium sp.]
MESGTIRSLGIGVNQQGLRDHNERLILSTLQRHGPLPGSDLARAAGLSAQTVSVILRGLESAGLIRRGEPQRGRVGKPRVPMSLDPEGAFSVGLKIGRRSADLVLADIAGGVRRQLHTTYRWPVPADVFRFLREGLAAFGRDMTPDAMARIAGIGIAKPYEIWDWHEAIGAPEGALDVWRDVDYAAEVGRFSDLPVHLDNDGTAACRAEHIYGRGREFRDFAYFFVGSFIGGGIVLNHSVFEGACGNAGAFGSLLVRGPEGSDRQLIDTASLFLLEEALVRADLPTDRLWTQPQDWSGLAQALDPWIEATAGQLARAAISVCAVIDFEAVLIDGAFPPDVRARLVEGIRREVGRLDRRGLSPVRIEEGRVGGNARALGAATAPILARYLLNTHGGAAAA